jgi:hypothetical protein
MYNLFYSRHHISYILVNKCIILSVMNYGIWLLKRGALYFVIGRAIISFIYFRIISLSALSMNLYYLFLVEWITNHLMTGCHMYINGGVVYILIIIIQLLFSFAIFDLHTYTLDFIAQVFPTISETRLNNRIHHF